MNLVETWSFGIPSLIVNASMVALVRLSLPIFHSIKENKNMNSYLILYNIVMDRQLNSYPM